MDGLSLAPACHPHMRRDEVTGTEIRALRVRRKIVRLFAAVDEVRIRIVRSAKPLQFLRHVVEIASALVPMLGNRGTTRGCALARMLTD